MAQPCISKGTAAGLTLAVVSTVQCVLLTTVYSNILRQVDCFHPSLLMHELMTKVMWNCMFTPSYEKNYTFNYWEPLKCPTEDTLLYTY